MSISPPSGRRSAPARRRLLAVPTAAFKNVYIELFNDEGAPEDPASSSAPVFNSNRRKFRHEQRQRQRLRRNR